MSETPLQCKIRISPLFVFSTGPPATPDVVNIKDKYKSIKDKIMIFCLYASFEIIYQIGTEF